jgi:hypothetical protein
MSPEAVIVPQMFSVGVAEANHRNAWSQNKPSAYNYAFKRTR